MTTLAEISSRLRNALIWHTPSGPLTGKIGVSIIVWLVAWVILHSRYKNRTAHFDPSHAVGMDSDLPGISWNISVFLEAFAR